MDTQWADWTVDYLVASTVARSAQSTVALTEVSKALLKVSMSAAWMDTQWAD